jgi:hypothetical protein
MLIWIGICLVLIVLCILEFIYLWDNGEFIDILAVFVLLLSGVVFFGVLGNGLENRKASIEYSIVKSPVVCEQTCTYDEAMQIVEIHDINEWIEHAQLQRKVNGIFSLYPASVMDLEPID